MGSADKRLFSFCHWGWNKKELPDGSTSYSGVAKEVELSVVSDSDSDSDTLPDSGPPMINRFPDPDFSDFDKQKAENCFAVNQIWALQDSLESMPRFYGRIKKIYNPEFFIKISWLEPHPENQREVKTDLPAVCGKFIRGDSDYISDRHMFSHQVSCKKGAGGVYIVYPRKGETWALLKDWDSNWSANPDNHRKYKYAFVEILSDYVGDSGVQVGYLDKVTGFVSIFQRTRLTEVGTFWVTPKDIYKFSHRIPSFKMTGTEGESVPKGSFELDPASLPLNSDKIWYAGKVKEDGRTHEATDKVRRSPVRANISAKKRNLMSPCPSTDLGGNCVKKSRVSSLKEEPNSGQASSGAIKPEHTDDSEAEPDSEPIVHVCPDPEFSDFDKHKAENCFAVGQVWACYDAADFMPRFYAQIRKVFRGEFNIKVRWLEVHSGYQRKRAWFKAGLPVGCGEFRRGGTDLTSGLLTFSHQMQCQKGKRGLYTVYPMKGETWALFKDWDIRWSSDPENHRKYKYEIVEILSDYTGDAGVQVCYLDKVTGFLSIFQRTRLIVGGAFFVKPKELYKFSHRIPSFKMTGAEGEEGVPVGSFELDLAALPLDPNDIWYPGKVKKEDCRTDEASDKVRRSPVRANISVKMRSMMSFCPSTDLGGNCVKKSRRSSLKEEPNSGQPSSGAIKPEHINDTEAQPGCPYCMISNPPQPTLFAMPETLWTGCRHCMSRYQYSTNCVLLI